ncbi:extracellular serine/threonine protein kinase fam20c [Plakobranchus ocellatus]|uniref:Extracellular serine/threonine protein kinase fam20c n=1 Tax=Plakobranchus ocellatus TaxID=259542 RepID=A0AAV3ZPU2_9GAST|nr:extracellular serine/threonine protein kinase fam20c [Plakobranchus ocellatus]
MRKGLDKSTANNSSSLHYVEWDGKKDAHSDPKLANQRLQKPWKQILDGSTFQERERVAGLVIHGVLSNHGNDMEDKTNDNNNDKENGQRDLKDEDEEDEEIDEKTEEKDLVDTEGVRLSNGDFTVHKSTQDRHRKQNSNDGKASDAGQSVKNYTLPEVDRLVNMFSTKYMGSSLVSDDSTSYQEFLQKLQQGMKFGPRLKEFADDNGKKSWEQFHHGIRQHVLYNPNEPYVNQLMSDLVTKEIVDAEQKDGGTQIKLMITCEDDGQALFKPMRFPREQETLPDHFYFADYERHHAEVGAFHLDKALGFYRVPPTVGRWVNISKDIHRVANSKLAKTFFISPVGNWCFHGSCSYYCDSSHPICGHPIMLEGSMAAFLPPLQLAKRKTWRNPWKRSYSKHRKAYWEVYDDLCHKVKRKAPYDEGRRLLDVLDMSVFDFLIGNLDRHHYETFREFGNETFLLHLDNGRAFGKAHYDCISCLAPVRQCCMIRQSTFAKLVKFYQGPDSLSHVMRTSLASDSLAPILLEPHLDALDRRLSKILHVIHGCIKDPENPRRLEDVVVDDGIT